MLRRQAFPEVSDPSCDRMATSNRARVAIKLNSYFLDLSHLTESREVRDRYVNPENPPASTAIQVPRLFRPEFLVEVEAVAVVKAW